MKKMRSLCVAVIALTTAMSSVTFANTDYSAASTPVYMFYSPYMNDYFLTASESECSSLEQDYANGTQTYIFTGTLGRAESFATGNNIPVYRFWNQDTTDHFYTASYEEKTATEDNYNNGRDGYKYEGIAFYIPANGYSAVYRFFNPSSFSHVYIADEAMKENLISSGSWRYEGVAWYW